MAGESLNRLNATGPTPLPRRRQIELPALAREADGASRPAERAEHDQQRAGRWPGLSGQPLAWIGFLDRRHPDQGLPVAGSLGLLVGLILLRGLIQAQVDIQQERLRSGFTDRLRQQLLHQVFEACLPSWIDWDAGSCSPC